MKWLPVLLTYLLAQVFAGGAPPPVLMFDGFQTELKSHWTDQWNCVTSAPPSWQWEEGTTRAGEAYESTNCHGGNLGATRLGNYLYYDPAAAQSWTDYTVEVSLHNTDDDGIGVAWRYQDDDNNYRVDCDEQRNYCWLIKRVSGGNTILAQSSDQCGGAYLDDAWLTFKVTAQGDTHEVSIDGVDCFGEVVDSDLSAGSVALYCWGSQACVYDYIRVSN